MAVSSLHLPKFHFPPILVGYSLGSHCLADWFYRVKGLWFWMEEISGEEAEVNLPLAKEAEPSAMEDGDGDCDDGNKCENEHVERQRERQGEATQVRL